LETTKLSGGVKNISRTVILIFSLLSLSSLAISGIHLAHAAGNSVNVISNPSFEQGSASCVFVPSQQCPDNWDFATCEGVDSATLATDQSQWTDGLSSARVSTGPVGPTGCFSGNFTGRPVGFSQFRTSLRGPTNQGYNFTALTDDPNEFSFWFRLEPYNGNGMAAFEVRVFGAESLAEMDYVINPDPSIGNFANSSQTHAIYFTGYNYGQWYRFNRNIKADWENAGLSESWNFTLLQFQGFATQTGNIAKSETYWLDDVRVYVGTGPIPVENDYAYWSFKDANNNDATSVLNWTLTNSNGQTIAYTQGQFTLPPGPYFVQTYYRAYSSNNLILVQQIRLNQTNTIQVPLYPSSLVPNGHIALNNPVASLSVNSPDQTRGTIELQGSTGTQYVMLVDVASGPVLIQANGYDLNQGYEWTYETTLSVARISFNMASGGENITIVFQLPVRIPNLSFVDREGASLDSKIRFSIFDSQGRNVTYIPGAVLPPGTFYLEAYYAGFRIYRNNLASIGAPPVTLQMIQLDTTSGSYLALNSTATAILPTQFNSSQIAFSITGTGPYLIVVNVPKRPLYVEEDGVRTPNWVYNSTNQVISIEASGPGSFLVVLDQPGTSNYLYLAIGATAAIVAAIGVYAWNRRRRKPVGPQAGMR